MQNPFRKRCVANALFIAAPCLFSAGIAALGGAYAWQGYTWYMGLQTLYSLPPVLFAILWGVACALTGAVFSRTLIRSSGKSGALFLLNGVLTALWCYLFFSLHSLPGSLMVILVSLLVSFLLLAQTCRVTRLGWLIVPYILWLGFLLWINYDIALCN